MKHQSQLSILLFLLALVVSQNVPAASVGDSSSKDLKEALVSNKKATIFSKLLNQSGALDVLGESARGWTVFVPPDSSWPKGLPVCLQQHPELLKGWIYRHILQWRWAPTLPYQGFLERPSSDDTPLRFEFDGHTSKVNGIKVSGKMKRFSNGNFFWIAKPLDLSQIHGCGFGVR